MHTPDYPEAFRRDGFVTLKGFLNSTEVTELRAAVSSLLDLPHDYGCSRPHNTLLPFRWNHRIAQITLASKPRMDSLKRALGADDLKWISGYGSIKEAHSPPLWWHQDWWCWDHPVSYRQAASQVAVLCYLTATNIQSGALRVLPGSHHRSLPIHTCLPDTNAHLIADIEPNHIAMRDHPDQVTLGMGAGDAIAIDYRLLHGTHGNASGARRDCIILNFTPSWHSLPADVRAHLISHPSLPTATEFPAAMLWASDALPEFFGERRDLPLNRVAPHKFDCYYDSTISSHEVA